MTWVRHREGSSRRSWQTSRCPSIAPVQALVNDWVLAGGVEPVVLFRIGTLQGMKRAIRDGAGVGIVSSYSVEPEDPVLATFPLARAPRRHFFLVSRDHGWESNVVRAFREFALSMRWADGDSREFHRAETQKG